MYDDLLNSTCSIYRLEGISGDFNLAASVDGSVTENWELKYSGVACRLDRFSTRSERSLPGVVERGTGLLFVKVGTDIQDEDRVSLNSRWYLVNDVITVEGFSENHHKECIVTLIDWKS